MTLPHGFLCFKSHSEYTPGSAVGDVGTITQTPRFATVHTVRDTELAKIPRQLFYFLALRYPQAMIQISKSIATKSQANPSPAQSRLHQHHVKTVAILPLSTTDTIPLDLFAQGLLLELNRIGPSIMIDNASVVQHLGKNGLPPITLQQFPATDFSSLCSFQFCGRTQALLMAGGARGAISHCVVQGRSDGHALDAKVCATGGLHSPTGTLVPGH